MSGKAIIIVRDLDLRPSEKSILKELAWYINEQRADDYVWPSIATLMKRTNYSRRTCQRALRGLEQLDYITCIKLGGGRASSKYEINLNKLSVKVKRMPQRHPYSVIESPQPRHRVAPAMSESRMNNELNTESNTELNSAEQPVDKLATNQDYKSNQRLGKRKTKPPSKQMPMMMTIQGGKTNMQSIGKVVSKIIKRWR